MNDTCNDFQSIETDVILGVVADLRDDYFRQGGRLDLDDVLRAADRAGLEQGESTQVVSLLAAADVAIEEPDEQLGFSPKSPPSGSRSAEADAVRAYFREMAKYPLLTAEDEVVLARRYEAGREAAARIGKAEETQSLRVLAQSGDNARDRMILANLRLVVSVARRYRNRGLALGDLIQAGNLGLMRAVEKFDHSLGFKFSTYATHWIQQAIQREIQDTGRTIRVPVHVQEALGRLKRARASLWREFGHEPSQVELADHLDVSTSKVELMLLLLRLPSSLDDPVGEDEGSTVGDFIPSSNSHSPETELIDKAIRTEVQDVLTNLAPREAEVIRRRFGIPDGNKETLEEIASTFNVTRERVRQIQAKALKKLTRGPGGRRLHLLFHGIEPQSVTGPTCRTPEEALMMALPTKGTIPLDELLQEASEMLDQVGESDSSRELKHRLSNLLLAGMVAIDDNNEVARTIQR